MNRIRVYKRRRLRRDEGSKKEERARAAAVIVLGVVSAAQLSINLPKLKVDQRKQEGNYKRQRKPSLSLLLPTCLAAATTTVDAKFFFRKKDALHRECFIDAFMYFCSLCWQTTRIC